MHRGGGRVAVYCTGTSFPLTNFHLGGGTIGFRGIAAGAGTLFLKPASQRGTVYVDNEGSAGELTEMTGTIDDVRAKAAELAKKG